MSDISSDSSFERISDSDHSDVRRKKKPTDAVQSSDDSDDDLLQSANDSNAILSEETKKKLHKQKLADAEAKGFSKGLLTSGFMLMICFLVIGVNALFIETSSGVPHNASSIVEKINVTMENAENVDKFSKEKKQKFLDDVEIEKENVNKFLKISESRKIIQGVTDIRQIPVYLWKKFIPDFSRFEGVDEFLQQTQTNGTIVEDYLYHTTPRFRIDDEGASFIHFVIMNTSEKAEIFWIKDCKKYSSCHRFICFMKNGNLQIDEIFVLESQEYKFTRVYFIPLHELI